jgi:hypothetical protein
MFQYLLQLEISYKNTLCMLYKVLWQKFATRYSNITPKLLHTEIILSMIYSSYKINGLHLLVYICVYICHSKNSKSITAIYY